jgi:hypothetical protein
MLEMRTLAWAICTSLQVRRARLVGASQHQSPHPNVERRDVRVGAPVSGQGVPAALSRFLADLHGPGAARGVLAIAVPLPVLDALAQSALHRVPVNVAELSMGIVVARLKSYPSQNRRVGGRLIGWRSGRTQGPSTALRSGRDDRLFRYGADQAVVVVSRPSEKIALGPPVVLPSAPTSGKPARCGAPDSRNRTRFTFCCCKRVVAGYALDGRSGAAGSRDFRARLGRVFVSAKHLMKGNAGAA